jgi:transcription regulator MmyB-like protein
LRLDALADPATAQTIVNWPEVAWAGLDRLRENAKRAPFDPGLQALIGRTETALAGVPRPQPAEAGLIVCPWLRIGGSIVRTIALTAGFDRAADVTLDELRAELIYPLDEQADRFFRSHDGGARTARCRTR